MPLRDNLFSAMPLQAAANFNPVWSQAKMLLGMSASRYRMIWIYDDHEQIQK